MAHFSTFLLVRVQFQHRFRRFFFSPKKKSVAFTFLKRYNNIEYCYSVRPNLTFVKDKQQSLQVQSWNESLFGCFLQTHLGFSDHHDLPFCRPTALA